MALLDEKEVMAKEAEEKAADTHTHLLSETASDAVTDIDLSVTAKKRFRVNGDNNRILELNTSDMSIISRLSVIEPKLEKLAVSVQEFATVDGEDAMEQAGKKLEEVDTEMRKLIDEIFLTNVSEVCAPKYEGSMYDPFNGKFRFEWVLEKMIDLCTDNIQNEFKKMTTKTAKHTAKYTKPKKRKK